MSSFYRYYQEEADAAICKELLINNKCLVKMFCGTGKSLLMRECKITRSKSLVVYTFPSLGLIEQFTGRTNTDRTKGYLNDFPCENILIISSELDNPKNLVRTTTSSSHIKTFLSRTQDKIICVTYQSFNTLLDNLDGRKIDVCIFDEAHHAVGNVYQHLIFGNNACEKQIFFTATPRNANGIVMLENGSGMCGKLVYDYSYYRGMSEGYLNPFEIRIDMYTENTNKSVYESIARAILTTGNNRVLTFHSNVNTTRSTSVNSFVDTDKFSVVFDEIQKKEFPENTKYKKIKMVALSSATSGKDQDKMLVEFDGTEDDEAMVISSCRTIGEGIDTKNANMIVFVDPKTSHIGIIQNIGRIVRKHFGVDKPNSTILIPCWVDKTKYLECADDKQKCDEVIRQNMGESGNFEKILNVLSALKQEDNELYEICLRYPDKYSPHEIIKNLETQGFMVGEPVGSWLETLEYLLDTNIDSLDMERIAEEHKVSIEVFGNSLETPIERYNQSAKEVVRIYEDENGFRPILQKETNFKRSEGSSIEPPDRNRRSTVRVHVNSEISVLWKIVGDIRKEICSCVIESEVVVKYDAMETAQGIVERYKLNGNVLPLITGNEQEKKDALKLSSWKGDGCCSDEVRDYLDKELSPDWRKVLEHKSMEGWRELVERYRLNGNVLPSQIKKKNWMTPADEQQHKDAIKIRNLKEALRGGKGVARDDVTDYLDKAMPGWRDKKARDMSKKSMKLAEPSVPKETPEQKKQRTKSEHSILLQRYKTLTSENLGKEFKQNIEKFYEYHELSGTIEKTYPPEEIPRNRIIRELEKTKTKRTKKVVDMGCGKAGIAEHFIHDPRFEFISYDHVSSNELVISCDISHTPLEDNSVEICILSLAMWGSNCREYISEVARILESDGKLYIIEPTKRWSEKDANGNNVAGEEGGKLKLLLEENGFHIVESSVEKFCLFVCSKK